MPVGPVGEFGGGIGGGGGGGGSGVSSFNTRTGAVVPATGDYTVSEVTGAAPLASPTFTGTVAIPTPTGTAQAGTALNALLGATYYEPASSSPKSTASTSLVAIDTTDLTLSFTAISTVVVVELEALVGIFSGSTAAALFWALFTHSTTTQVGYTTTAQQASITTVNNRVRATIRIAGLTAGTAYQVDWAWASANASDTWAMSIQATTGVAGAGPAIMRAYAG
jgi:hypothetical protein